MLEPTRVKPHRVPHSGSSQDPNRSRDVPSALRGTVVIRAVEVEKAFRQECVVGSDRRPGWC